MFFSWVSIPNPPELIWLTELILAAFLSSLLKDIKSERPKITEKDNLRLLFITKWFLEFFLQAHAKEKALKKESGWDFGFVAEVTDRAWIAWVLRRMHEALDAKVFFIRKSGQAPGLTYLTAENVDGVPGWH